MKRFILLLFLFTAGVFYGQDSPVVDQAAADSTLTVPDSTAVVVESATKELSDEELLCKQSAEDLMKIYEKWDVSKDYDILIPRITGYVEKYFKTGTEPNESNRRDLSILKENYDLLLDQEISETLVNLISLDLERVNAELEGNQKNPALIGWLEKMDFDKIKALEEALIKENNPEISKSVVALRSSFKNIRRYSIGFDEMLNSIYKEITRITDKRIYFLYIEDDVKNKLQEISVRLAEEVNKKEPEFAKKMQDDIDKAYEEKEKASNSDNYDLKKKLYGQWIETRKVNIDKLKSAEVSRLSTIIAGYITSQGGYDVNSTLVHKLQLQSPDLEEYFKGILRAKFFNDLNSKFKVYFRFEVENGFRFYRINVFIASLFFFGLFFFVYTTVRKKKDSIYIRRIPGLDAIDDAVGRATEMGKPIIYDSGLGAFSSPQTIASMLILRSVAKKVAEFKAEIIYPAYDPVVLQIAEEMIASGFLDAGYPEDHKKDNCFFMVGDQFAFAAGLSGLIARKKPATALHFGYYAAESLLISEAGFAAGAIQVAGTTEATQLPFFITSCDYMLIGEELYAAAAYLSRDPQVLSNLKLSDYGKLIFGILFLLGTILLTINSDWTIISDILSTY